jgi:succinate-semialdehyde dehydrogenase / glutarate-semialdehyde dehydrogenase
VNLRKKTIKPFVLELGGSDPFIVLESADIEKAVQASVKSRFLNAGQSCIVATRFIVVEDIVVDFLEVLESRVEELKVGNSMDEETDIWPVAKKVFIDRIEKVLKEETKK